MFCIGIDKNEDVFVAPKTWKRSENETFWPPKVVKDVTALVKRQSKPNIDWQIFKCRWLAVTAGKTNSYLSNKKMCIVYISFTTQKHSARQN